MFKACLVSGLAHPKDAILDVRGQYKGVEGDKEGDYH